MPQPTKEALPQSGPTGCLPLIAPVFSNMLGPGLLFFLAFLIAQRQAVSALDIAYFAVVVALILARHIDITRLGNVTEDGNPATLGHWRRFAFVSILISGALWLLAHTLLARFMAP